ncbi:unnamed protein product [Notodromas monacha]|uniref:F-box domain-containing protein n=1 Tax=Notodromas monacha TaxID=399045 RepID=A0A7R9G8U0_9CRUS|nr:unnamed protein product [Notodromas monacha]CAG0913566.1 unnamed protein product [Notodromas monacha]
MSAFLVRLDYGLRDLSYVEIGKIGSTSLNPWESIAAVFYIDLSEANDNVGKFHELKFKRVPLHVHRVARGTKLGEPCPKKDHLKGIFVIEAVPWGDFILDVSKKQLLDLNMKLRINQEWWCVERKDTRALNHGDIIEIFYRRLPYARFMLLLPEDGRGSNDQQTSPLLSCPWLVLKNIFEYMTPFETMENVVPVCRRFFELVKNGGIWSNVDLTKPELFGVAAMPWGHTDDFRHVLAGNVRRLAVDFKVREMQRLCLPESNADRPLFKADDRKNLKALEIYSWGAGRFVMKFLKSEALGKLKLLTIRDWPFDGSFLHTASNENLVLPNCEQVTLPLKILHLIDAEEISMRVNSSSREFLHFLGFGELRSLHAIRLPIEMNETAWNLAENLGTFENLDSLSLREDIFKKMPVSFETRFLFPKLKSFLLRDAAPGSAVSRLFEMPSLKRLWIRCAQPNQMAEPTRLHAFDESPKEWLEHLTFVAVDLWETYIPYSKMINLECVGLFFQHKGVSRSLESVVDELGACSKLRGLVLHVPEALPCDALSELPQRLEFAAFSGVNGCCLVSALKIFAESQKSLKDLWIHVPDPEDFGKILQAVKTFKVLENVLLVFRGNSFSTHNFESYKHAMKKYLVSSSCDRGLMSGFDQDFSVKQATLFNDKSFASFTYNFELEREIRFSSSSITKFFSWLKYIPSSRGFNDESSVFALVPSIFPYANQLSEFD